MQAKIEKPVVYFVGEPYYWMWNETNEVASLQAVLEHPRLGNCPDVRTSTVLQKFDDGSFETRNTIYKPATKEMQDDYNARVEKNRKEFEEWYENNKPTFSQTGLARKEK
jgi:hypothetical protein